MSLFTTLIMNKTDSGGCVSAHQCVRACERRGEGGRPSEQSKMSGHVTSHVTISNQFASQKEPLASAAAGLSFCLNSDQLHNHGSSSPLSAVPPSSSCETAKVCHVR